MERRLHQKLFHNYNMKVRPAHHWEEKVMVRVGMTLSQLVSLVGTNTPSSKGSGPSPLNCHCDITISLPVSQQNEKNEEMTTNVFMNLVRAFPSIQKWTCRFL